MTDKETDKNLLELAAKAAELQVVGMVDEMISQPDHKAGGLVIRNDRGGDSCWNPRTDDGDALRLAVKLGLVIDCSRPSAGEPYKEHAIWLDEIMGNEELTRRAIVRAAAEIGKAMP